MNGFEEKGRNGRDMAEKAGTAARSGRRAGRQVADDTESDRPHSDRRRNPYLLGSLALAVAAAVCAAVFGALWAQSALSDAGKYSRTRDRVLSVAQTAAMDFAGLDYRHLDTYRKRLENATTGQLHDVIGPKVQEFTKTVTDSQLVVKPTVMQAALSALDTHKGTATALVVVSAVDSTKGAKPQTRRLPMTFQLTRVGGDWKVSRIGGNAGVGTSAPSGQ